MRYPGKPKLKQFVSEASEICRKNNVELGKLANFHHVRVPGRVETFWIGMEKMEFLNHNMGA